MCGVSVYVYVCVCVCLEGSSSAIMSQIEDLTGNELTYGTQSYDSTDIFQVPSR